MKTLLTAANATLVLAMIALAVSVLVGYPFADYLSMPAQIAAHIGTLLFAIVIKLSYLARLVSLQALGRPVN